MPTEWKWTDIERSALPRDILDLLLVTEKDSNISREGKLINLILEARQDASTCRRNLEVSQELLRTWPTVPPTPYARAQAKARVREKHGEPSTDTVLSAPFDSDVRDPFPGPKFTQPGIPLTIIPPHPGLDRKLFTDILREIVPSFERESAFLYPYPQWKVGVIQVLDALRSRCNPPLSEQDVNQIMESLEQSNANHH